ICEYNLSIIVNFESRYNIKEGPFMKVFDRDEQFIQRKDCFDFDIEKKLYYTTYYFKFEKVQLNHKFIVKWKPD
ncbi:MAG: hypothetical protein QMD06_02100, partial [Candidatus Altarchaeum sp.]|nr:hypothetical protein [Candidatus Altarchaeum sp.]